MDLGCGSGRDSLYFIQKGYRVTAIDGSEEMVKLSSQLIKQPVLHMKFQEMDFQLQFDGVWACASLLHFNDIEIEDVIKRVSKSLKTPGLFYLSFKYGDKEEWNEGRYFRYHNEKSFEKIISKHKEFEILKMSKSKDRVKIRKDKEGEYWLNVLLKKRHD